MELKSMEKTIAEDKAKEHWKWLSEFLPAFGIELRPEYERLFIDAFLHGWKHCLEENWGISREPDESGVSTNET